MSGMETIKGKFQGLIDVLMPWEDVEVEEHKDAAAETSQQQAVAKPARAAAQEYKVSGGDSIYVERTEAQEPAPSFRARTQHPQLTVHTTKIPELRVQIYVPENFDQVTDIADNLKSGRLLSSTTSALRSKSSAASATSSTAPATSSMAAQSASRSRSCSTRRKASMLPKRCRRHSKTNNPSR